MVNAAQELPGMKEAVAVLTMMAHGDTSGAVEAVGQSAQPRDLAIALVIAGTVLLNRERDPEALLADLGQAVAELEAGI